MSRKLRLIGGLAVKREAFLLLQKLQGEGYSEGELIMRLQKRYLLNFGTARRWIREAKNAGYLKGKETVDT